MHERYGLEGGQGKGTKGGVEKFSPNWKIEKIINRFLTIYRKNWILAKKHLGVKRWSPVHPRGD
jgi:hypothetical protein